MMKGVARQVARLMDRSKVDMQNTNWRGPTVLHNML